MIAAKPLPAAWIFPTGNRRFQHLWGTEILAELGTRFRRKIALSLDGEIPVGNIHDSIMDSYYLDDHPEVVDTFQTGLTVGRLIPRYSTGQFRDRIEGPHLKRYGMHSLPQSRDEIFLGIIIEQCAGGKPTPPDPTFCIPSAAITRYAVQSI